MNEIFMQQLQNSVRTVPDFPIEGIMFRDITPVLADGKLLVDVVNQMVLDIEELGWEPTHIVGPESRGFIFGSMVALQMGIGFIPVRKPGKLPHEIERIKYSLEYGETILAIHKDALRENLHFFTSSETKFNGFLISNSAPYTFADPRFLAVS